MAALITTTINNNENFTKVGLSSNLFRGIVVDNQDPAKLCRLKVQIPSITGNLPADGLPWAYPCLPYAGAGYGMTVTPAVGSTVWVLFESGDKTKPVWIGCSFGGSTTAGDREMNNKSANGMFKASEGNWNFRLQEIDTPYEYVKGQGNVQVVYRSPKGASFLVSDKDEGEYIQLIDRIGQTIKMSGPTFYNNNADNDCVRFSGSIEDGDCITDKVKPAVPYNPYILIQQHSQDKINDSVVKLETDNAYIGNGYVFFDSRKNVGYMTDNEREMYVRLDKNDDITQRRINVTVSVENEETGQITTGDIEVRDKSITLDANGMRVEITDDGKMTVHGDVIIDGNLTVTGTCNCSSCSLCG